MYFLFYYCVYIWYDDGMSGSRGLYMDSGSRVSSRVSYCVCIDIWNGLYEHVYMKEVDVCRGLCFNKGVVIGCLERDGCICEVSELDGLYMSIKVIEIGGMSYGLYRISIDSLCDYICDIVSEII